MSGADPKREFAESIVRRLQQSGFTALWAGGCVRDYLLGKTPKDYDVATDARPNQVRALFGERRTLAVGESFGVIIVIGPRNAGQIEVATFRTDRDYSDGRRPDAIDFSSPEEDARRRDFTINGMFFDPVEHKVFDYVGGERDLAAGMIRAIGEPHARMREDKLRLLRAVRFTATFEFQLDPATADAVRNMAPQIHVVSAERIAQELRRMLVDTHRQRAIELSEQLGLLEHILPELAPLTSQLTHWQIAKTMLRLLQAPDFSLAFAALFHQIGECRMTTGQMIDPVGVVQTAGKRLRFSNQEIDAAVWLLKHRSTLTDVRGLSLATIKRILAAPLATDLLALMRARDLAQGHEPADTVYCEEFLRTATSEDVNPPALITGADLIQIGLHPGPKFKPILDAVRDAQLNAEISSREEAISLARQLAHI